MQSISLLALLAAIFFDDFHYPRHQEMTRRGWIVRSARGWPGVPGATWGPSGVTLSSGIVTMTDERWCIYILCVTVVLAAELFNTAIERLARAVTREEHPEIRDALDIAAGAVLMTSIGAGIVGVLMIGWPFVAQLAR